MIKISEILRFLNQKYKFNSAIKGDNVGLLIYGRANVEKVLVSLDITNSVVDYAIKNKVDTIITHHPLFFNVLNIDSYILKIYQKLLLKKINLIALHTNFDFAKFGLGDLYLRHLDFNNFEFIENMKLFKIETKLNITEIRDKISKRAPILIENSYIIKSQVNNFYFCPGSGSGLVKNLKKGDLMLTGELKHHDIIYLNDIGAKAFLIGHFHESKFKIFLSQAINENFSKKLKLILMPEDNPLIFNSINGK